MNGTVRGAMKQAIRTSGQAVLQQHLPQMKQAVPHVSATVEPRVTGFKASFKLN